MTCARTEAAPPMTGSQPRVALVIGNADYLVARSRLDNPVNDARLMKRSLESLGFDVLYGENQTNAEMRSLIKEFGKRLTKGCVALFYYAGHGAQYRGANFLIPVEARSLSEDGIDSQAVNVDLLLDEISAARSDVNIVILDACRDNPLTRSWGTAPEGLASIKAPKGTVIAYATSPGSVAEDGRSPNSPYTTALLRWLKEPCLRIEDLFKRVRRDVLSATNERQLTWESLSLVGDFYLSGGGCAAAPPVYENYPKVARGRKAGKILFALGIVSNPVKEEWLKTADIFPISASMETPLIVSLEAQQLTVTRASGLQGEDFSQYIGAVNTRYKDESAMRSLPYALYFNAIIESVVDSESEFNLKVSILDGRIEVVDTENGKTILFHQFRQVRGFGNTHDEARRNALRAAAQSVPESFFKDTAEKAK